MTRHLKCQKDRIINASAHCMSNCVVRGHVTVRLIVTFIITFTVTLARTRIVTSTPDPSTMLGIRVCAIVTVNTMINATSKPDDKVTSYDTVRHNAARYVCDTILLAYPVTESLRVTGAQVRRTRLPADIRTMISHLTAWIIVLSRIATIQSPIHALKFLSDGTRRNIGYLRCVSLRTGESGVCMIPVTCIKLNGTPLGTCFDRFYFGSCCKLNDDDFNTHPQDNAIDDPSAAVGIFGTTDSALESNDIPDYLRPKPIIDKTPETTTSTTIGQTVKLTTKESTTPAPRTTTTRTTTTTEFPRILTQRPIFFSTYYTTKQPPIGLPTFQTLHDYYHGSSSPTTTTTPRTTTTTTTEFPRIVTQRPIFFSNYHTTKQPPIGLPTFQTLHDYFHGSSSSTTTDNYHHVTTVRPVTLENSTSIANMTGSTTARPITSTILSTIATVTTARPVTLENSTSIANMTGSTTARPITSTILPTIPTVTMASNLPVPMETLNMSDYKQVCGRRLFPKWRIVGGDDSSFGRWPWQISLRQWKSSAYRHKCGAALLNENWAITAAHCVEKVSASDLLLRIGEHDFANNDEPYGFQERRVYIVASHPQFDPRTFEYDLALLQFYEPLQQFQPNILPICLPDDDENYVGHTAYVTGWGKLYEDGPIPAVLQEVSVPVVNNTVCEAMYRNAGYIEHIPNVFICAGRRKGGFDSCEGDSGGPMVIQRPRDKRWILAGVISWGIGCAKPNQPGVYTRISEFREWINQIIQL